MTIAERLKADMVAAMKAGEKEKLGAIRFVSSELMRAAKDAGMDVATDEVATAVLNREAKRRRDAIVSFQEGGRDDLVAETQGELDVIASYLPEPLSDDELRAIVAEVVKPGDNMGAAIKEVNARAEGGKVAAMVREALGA
jgi:uncharacterized protein